MDHYQLGKSAFEARKFFEAETHFRKALKSASAENSGEILVQLFEVAKRLRPEEAWREAIPWMRDLANQRAWKKILGELQAIEPDIPASQQGFIHELRAEAFFCLGAYGEARSASAKHLEYLLKKKLTPQLVTFSTKYRERFPLTVLFYFHEVSSAAAIQDYASTDAALKRLLSVIETRWHQLEDVTGKSRSVLLSETHKALEAFDSTNGEAVLLGHYCRLVALSEAKLPLEKDDWKKLAELLIHRQSWRNWKIALEISIASGDEALAAAVHQQLIRKKGFSFVKLTRHNPPLKTWLLARGHDRTSLKDEALDAPKITDADLVLSEAGDQQSFARELMNYVNDAEEEQVEASALRQLRLTAPPLDVVPDLIVTYEMLGFGRVVDWLIASYVNSDEYPKVQKKIRYFSVLRDMQKKNYHHALATLEVMLGDKDITLEELKELRYAQGAIYQSLGESARAKALFAEVEDLEPGYRRLRERNS